MFPGGWVHLAAGLALAASASPCHPWTHDDERHKNRGFSPQERGRPVAAQWFVRGAGKVYGPLDDAKLRSLVAEGKIDEMTDVSIHASGPWHAAKKVRGLFTSENSTASKSPAPNRSRTALISNLVPGDALPGNLDERSAGIAVPDQPTPPGNSPPPTPPGAKFQTTLAAWSMPKKVLAAAGGLLLVVAVAVAVVAAGAAFLAPRQLTLLGSVFIVKADGESVRLGLTTVHVIPATDDTDEVVSEVKSALRSLRSAEFSLDYNSRPSEIDHAFSSPAVARRRRSDNTMEALTNRANALSQLDNARAILLRNSVSEVKTDANGEFQLQIPAKFASSIVAYASRKIGAHSEHYFWIIPSEDAWKQRPRLFLSNDNQLR
jgi:hypothetical protein